MRSWERGVLDVEPLRAFMERNDLPMVALRKIDSASYRQVYRAGRLSVTGADTIACAFGVHPCVIWSDWFDLPVSEEAVA